MRSLLVFVIGAMVSLPSFAGRSDLQSMMRYVTPERNQGDRNTCMIFAATALAESIFLRVHTNFRPQDVNFSEQYLQYVHVRQSDSNGVDGSRLANNYSLLKRYGIAWEAQMPYEEGVWASSTRAAQRACGSLSGGAHTQCLMAQKQPGLLDISMDRLLQIDPEFAAARQTAQESLGWLFNSISFGAISKSDVKRLLDANIPVNATLPMFYESWNFEGYADRLNYEADAGYYARGVVTYPDPGSNDRINSPSIYNLHGILVVGYDDEEVVVYRKKMADGSIREFQKQGVFYFKNSWGGDNFGRRTELPGVGRKRGFGIITQAYLNDFGSFYGVSRLPR